MILLADSRLTLDHVQDILTRLNVSTWIFAPSHLLEQSSRPTMLRAAFPESGMGFVYSWELPSSNWLPEFAPSEVSSSATFRMVMAKYGTCVYEMHNFLQELTNISDVDFSFSYEYDELWAYRDVAGLHFEQPFVEVLENFKENDSWKERGGPG